VTEDRRRSSVTAVVSVLVLCFLWAPLFVVVLFSFHSAKRLTLPFDGFSTRWYHQVLETPAIRDSLLYSLEVALIASLVTVGLGTLAAYGLTRTASRLRRPLALLFFLPITLPGLFIGLALLAAFGQIKLKLSLATVLIGHLIYVFPFFLLVAIAALARLDRGLEEAAEDLGASRFQIFRRVTLPQTWPVIVGGGALAFALSFDEFVITYWVIGPKATLPVYIWARFLRSIDPTINVIATLMLVLTISVFVVAWLAERRASHSRKIGDVLTTPVSMNEMQ
jgi:spermidine/putrescine transport system permease protein